MTIADALRKAGARPAAPPGSVVRDGDREAVVPPPPEVQVAVEARQAAGDLEETQQTVSTLRAKLEAVQARLKDSDIKKEPVLHMSLVGQSARIAARLATEQERAKTLREKHERARAAVDRGPARDDAVSVAMEQVRGMLGGEVPPQLAEQVERLGDLFQRGEITSGEVVTRAAALAAPLKPKDEDKRSRKEIEQEAMQAESLARLARLPEEQVMAVRRAVSEGVPYKEALSRAAQGATQGREEVRAERAAQREARLAEKEERTELLRTLAGAKDNAKANGKVIEDNRTLLGSLDVEELVGVALWAETPEARILAAREIVREAGGDPESEEEVARALRDAKRYMESRYAPR